MPVPDIEKSDQAFERETFMLTADRETWEFLLRWRGEELDSWDEAPQVWHDELWEQLEKKLEMTKR